MRVYLCVCGCACGCACVRACVCECCKCSGREGEVKGGARKLKKHKAIQYDNILGQL